MMCLSENKRERERERERGVVIMKNRQRKE